MNIPKFRDVVIIEGARTPIGHFGKSLRDVPALDLGAIAIKEAVKRANISEKLVDDVIMGAIHQEGMGNNPARIAALKAGIPHTSGALTVNNVCSSGMKSVEIAYRQIAMGEHDIIIAGGMESNSQCPYMLMNARWGYRLHNQKLVDALFYDGFNDTYGVYGNYRHVGETAERIINDARILCKKYNLNNMEINFEEINRFSLNSHKKYFKAKSEGFFEEIIPIDMDVNGRTIKLAYDESPRKNLTLEKLNNLKPVFREGGLVTAGNTPPLNDGAAALVLASREKANQLEISPIGEIKAFSQGNVEPEYMGLGPIPAIRNLLIKTDMNLSNIDIFEINEAQAQQVLFCIRGLEIPIEIVNIHGGAIAIGHPPGMTGTRLILTALYSLNSRDERYAICTQCAGGGTGMGVLLESQ
ncbi:MAG: putative acetyl-CoA acyltransferase [Promethearchaeota archaeon]|nr:MAG: putative acetyl-CoA acyltransferase [Candidatus Lokiarchaeota archaeon]